MTRATILNALATAVALAAFSVLFLGAVLIISEAATWLLMRP